MYTRWRSSYFAMSELQNRTGGADAKALTVALCGSNDERRTSFAQVLSAHSGVRVREFVSFPANETIPDLVQHYSVVVVDIDSDSNRAFEFVERLVTDGSSYVMAYSARADMKVAVRFMRAGVREFFTLPLDSAEVAAALTRAAQHQGAPRTGEKSPGKLFIFLGSKGGCGVTTLASNFALALAQESEQSTLLVDLGLPLGDVAINLGMRTQYSVANALQDADRLDSSFLRSLVATHSSGLNVLAAPNDFREMESAPGAMDKLTLIARQSYEFVVVDAGSRVELISTAPFEQCSAIYLVTQVGISELRNANRMIAQFFSGRGESLQIVLNRYTPKTLLFDDSQITKSLSRPAQWKIPDDWAAARRTRNTATPMVMNESAISDAIRDMARGAAGVSGDKETKRGLFRLLR